MTQMRRKRTDDSSRSPLEAVIHTIEPRATITARSCSGMVPIKTNLGHQLSTFINNKMLNLFSFSKIGVWPKFTVRALKTSTRWLQVTVSNSLWPRRGPPPLFTRTPSTPNKTPPNYSNRTRMPAQVSCHQTRFELERTRSRILTAIAIPTVIRPATRNHQAWLSMKRLCSSRPMAWFRIHWRWKKCPKVRPSLWEVLGSITMVCRIQAIISFINSDRLTLPIVQ